MGPPMEHDQRGMTLIEIMVAVAIMALISVGIVSALRMGVQSWRRGDVYTDEAQRLRALADTLTREIAGAYPYMIRHEGKMSAAFQGREHSLYLVTTASRNQASAPSVGLKVILLEVDDDPQSGHRGLLLREAFPNPQEIVAEDDMRTILLDPDVKEVRFRYLFYDKGTMGRLQMSDEPLWVRQWIGTEEELDAGDLGEIVAAIGTDEAEGDAASLEERAVRTIQRYVRFRMPRAVEVTLTIIDRRGRERVLEPIIVPIVGGARVE